MTQDNQDPLRKRHVTDGKVQYPRKRAAIACEFCRARKSRCDNVKPICGFCHSSGVICSFSDVANPSELTGTCEPSSSVILERIDYAISLLESNHRQAQASQTGNGLRPFSTPASLAPLSQTTSPINWTALEIPPAQTVFRAETIVDLVLKSAEIADILEWPGGSLACERLLDWHSLRGFAPVGLQSFLWEPDLRLTEFRAAREYDGWKHPNPSLVTTGTAQSRDRSTINDAHIVQLVNRYLALVHVKNPILDINKLKQYAAEVAEHGIDWDGPSCLVLLVCAIASVVATLDLQHPLSDNTKNASTSSWQAPNSHLVSSEAFFNAARKRLGIIEDTLICAQCHYLAGIYEMCCMRVLRAWAHYQQAGVHLQVILCQKPQSCTPDTLLSQESQEILERLQFSCVKTENELRAQIPFLPGGITKLTLPNPLPSPPQSHFRRDPSLSESDAIHTRAGNYPETDTNEQRGWFYYLAEISVLRTTTRMLQTLHPLYDKDNDWWDANSATAIKQVLDFEIELDLWASHLPPQISWKEKGTPSNELSYILQRRTTMLKTALYQPFLFCIFHHKVSNSQSHASVLLMAQKCLQNCVEALGNMSTVSNQWRHGGAWFSLRGVFQNALILLATVRSRKLDAPEGWEVLIEQVLEALGVWEEEASDIRWMKFVLDALMRDTTR